MPPRFVTIQGEGDDTPFIIQYRRGSRLTNAAATQKTRKSRKKKGSNDNPFWENEVSYGAVNGQRITKILRPRPPRPPPPPAPPAPQPDASSSAAAHEPHSNSPNPFDDFADFIMTDEPPVPRMSISNKNSRRETRRRGWRQWRSLIPSLCQPFMLAEQKMLQKQPLAPLPHHSPDAFLPFCHECHQRVCIRQVDCVSHTAIETRNITVCKCESIAATLIASGFFPSTTELPRVAFSFDVLNSYLYMTAIHHTPLSAFREGLVAVLESRGNEFTTKEPFRHQLPEALTWFEALKWEVEVGVEEFLWETEGATRNGPSDERLPSPPASPTPTRVTRNHMPFAPVPTLAPTPPTAAITLQDMPETTSERHHLVPGEAHPILRARCPHCFGRKEWGRETEKEPDVIVCTDGNFSHRQYQSVNEDPIILSLSGLWFFPSEEELDDAKRHVEECRSNPARPSQRADRLVPEEALNNCESSHHAAQDRGAEHAPGMFRYKGLMALVCRHDIPLFLCDITTPGEQQFYVIAMLRRLASLMPPVATIGLLYDIGCQLDRSIGKHNLVPELSGRLNIALALFHSYVHQFPCQMIYHPRKRAGFGWTNGEGNERLWSAMTDIIAVERVLGPNKRRMTILRKLVHISARKKAALTTLARRAEDGLRQAAEEAEQFLRDLPYSRDDLRLQWDLQKEHQLSVRNFTARSSAQGLTMLVDAQKTAGALSEALERLKNELDDREYRQTLNGTGDLASLYTAANALHQHHQESVEQLHKLMADLGLTSIPLPPHFDAEDRNFVKTLIVLQALKATLWLKLQRHQDELNPIHESTMRHGVRGTGRIGTKALQGALRAVKRRGTAVLHCVDAFNRVVEELRQLPRPAWVPGSAIPEMVDRQSILTIDPDAPLWHELAVGGAWLQLWGPENNAAPLYARDPQVRLGIKMLLNLDRVLEERKRLVEEKLNAQHAWCQDLVVAVEAYRVAIFTADPRHHRLYQRIRHLIASKPQTAILSGVEFLGPVPEECRVLVNGLVQSSSHSDGIWANAAGSEPVMDDIFADGFDNMMETQPETPLEPSHDANTYQFLEPAPDLPPATEPSAEETDGSDSENDERGALAYDLHAMDSLLSQLSKPSLQPQHHGPPMLPPFRDIDAGPLLDQPNPDPFTTPVRRAPDPERQKWREAHPVEEQRLPSIQILLSAQRSAAPPSPYYPWSLAMEPCNQSSAARMRNDGMPRQYRDIHLSTETLKRLDKRRWLNDDIIAAYGYMLVERVDSHPVARAFPQHSRPKVFFVEPHHVPLNRGGMLHTFIDHLSMEPRLDLLNYNAWVIPFNCKERQHWILGVIDFDTKRFVYNDSLPRRDNNPAAQCDQWLWDNLRLFLNVASLFMIGSQYDFTGWVCDSATYNARQHNGYDCGLWVLADIEAVLLGSKAAAPDRDMEQYRYAVRASLLSLPPLVSQPPDGQHFSDRSALKGLRKRADDVLQMLELGVVQREPGLYADFD